MSDLAFFHGEVELNGAKTFAECNISAGEILTMRQAPVCDVKRKRQDTLLPEPEDRQQTPPLPAKELVSAPALDAGENAPP